MVPSCRRCKALEADKGWVSREGCGHKRGKENHHILGEASSRGGTITIKWVPPHDLGMRGETKETTLTQRIRS